MKSAGTSIAFAYLPTILQRKNSVINVSLKQTYIDYLIVFSPGFVAVLLSVFMVRAPMVGRKWTLVFSSMAMGMSLFLFSIVNTQASEVGFNMLEYFCQTLFNAAVSSVHFVLAAWFLKDTIVALWMDSRGVPGCDPGNCDWFGRVLWQLVWNLCSTDRCAAIRQHEWEQRSVVPGWRWLLCIYDCSVLPPDQGHGRTTMNGMMYMYQVDVSLAIHYTLDHTLGYWWRLYQNSCSQLTFDHWRIHEKARGH